MESQPSREDQNISLESYQEPATNFEKLIKKKKIMLEPVCQIEKIRVEDVFHALMECKVVRKLWKYTYINVEI